MGDLSDFEKGQNVGARLAGVSVTKTDTLLGVLRAKISKVMLAYTSRGKTSSAKRNWVKIKFGRKRSLYTERDCFEKITELLQLMQW
jgi:hypothetical protein